MTDNRLPNVDELLPGDRVRVIDGTFIGLEGMVLTRDGARKLHEKNGGQEEPLTGLASNALYVALPLFGREVPVILLQDQIERIEQ